MKCQKCKTNLVTRSGKFGEFWACPKSNPKDNHGTVSAGQPAYNYTYHSSGVNLDNQIQRQMMYFGGGRMTDLDLFVEGGYEAAMDDEEEGSYASSHWMNTREY